MKKVLVASLLSAVALACVAPGSCVAFAQAAAGAQAAPAAQGAQAGSVQLSPAEYAVYNDAITKTTPQAKAVALGAI